MRRGEVATIEAIVGDPDAGALHLRRGALRRGTEPGFRLPSLTRNPDNHATGNFINPNMMDKHLFANAVEVTGAESVAWQRAIARAIADEGSRPEG
jgi:hypothetical protein